MALPPCLASGGWALDADRGPLARTAVAASAASAAFAAQPWPLLAKFASLRLYGLYLERSLKGEAGGEILYC